MADILNVDCRSCREEQQTVRRLTEGLREISAEASKGIRAENRLPFLTHIGVIAERTLAGDPERHVRALLSASPSDGPDDFCEHGYTTENAAHPSAGLERCPTCSPSDGGGA